MARKLIAHTAPAENPSSVPNTHLRWLTTALQLQLQRSWCPWTQLALTLMATYPTQRTYTYFLKTELLERCLQEVIFRYTHASYIFDFLCNILGSARCCWSKLLSAHGHPPWQTTMKLKTESSLTLIKTRCAYGRFLLADCRAKLQCTRLQWL